MTRTRAASTVGPYPFWFILFQALCAAVAVLALIVGVSAGITNNRQDAEARAANDARDKTTASFLECFDILLGRSAVRSTALNTAAEEVTKATLARDLAQGRWIGLLVRALALNPAEGSDEAVAIGIRFQRLTSDLQKTQRTVVAAQRAQAKARRLNPVLPGPSSFCEVDENGELVPPPKPAPTPKKSNERNP